MVGISDLAFEHGPDAMLVLSQRRILKASSMVEEVFGWRPADLVGQSTRVLYPAQVDYEVIGQRAFTALQAHPVYRDERFMRRQEGPLIWVEARGRAMDRHDPWRLAVWVYRPLEGQGNPVLTAAERQVAGYLANGFSSKEIAASLGRSPRTVEVHRANMIRKLGVRNSTELVRKLLGGPQDH